MKKQLRILGLVSVPFLALGSYGLVSAEPILPHLRSPQVVVKRSPARMTPPAPVASNESHSRASVVPVLLQVATPLGNLYITLHPPTQTP